MFILPNWYVNSWSKLFTSASYQLSMRKRGQTIHTRCCYLLGWCTADIKSLSAFLSKTKFSSHLSIRKTTQESLSASIKKQSIKKVAEGGWANVLVDAMGGAVNEAMASDERSGAFSHRSAVFHMQFNDFWTADSTSRVIKECETWLVGISVHSRGCCWYLRPCIQELSVQQRSETVEEVSGLAHWTSLYQSNSCWQ